MGELGARLLFALAMVAAWALPGGLLYRRLGAEVRLRPEERGLLSLSLGLSAIPVVLYGVSLLGIRLSEALVLPLFVLLAGVAAACAVPALLHLLRGRAWSRESREGLWSWLTMGGLGVLFLAILLTRLVPVTELSVPPGSDSYHHTLIAKLIVERGAVPDSYEPYAALGTFSYHFGFHALVAYLFWLAGGELTTLVLVTGQVLNAIAVVGLYLLASRGWGHAVALGSVFVAGFLSIFPAYSINWGRFPQVTGLALLPLAMFLTMVIVEEHPQSWRLNGVLAGVGVALFLTHYRIFGMFLLFVLIYLGCRVFGAGKRAPLRFRALARPLLCWALGILVLTPWFWRLGNSNLLAAALSPLPEGYFSLDRLGGAANFWSHQPLLMAAALGLLLGFLRRHALTIVVGLWGVLLLAQSNPLWLPLPGAGLVDLVTVMQSLYVPVSVLAAYFVMEGLRGLMAYHGVLAGVALVGFLALGLWNAGNLAAVLDKNNLWVRPSDLEAMRWIRSATPTDTRFLVATVPADNLLPGLVLGADAGSWIPVLTGRQTTLPPMIHRMEHHSQGWRDQHALSQVVSAAPHRRATLEALREEGISYVFVGSRRGNLDPSVFRDAPNYRLQFQQGPTYVFAVDYTAQDFWEGLALLDRLADRSVSQSGPSFRVLPLAVGGDTRRALVMAAPQQGQTRVAVSPQIPSGAKLRFALGLAPEASHDPRADGMAFVLMARQGEGEVPLFSEFVAPGRSGEQQGWLEREVDLSPLAGKDIYLIFAVGPGPRGNNWADWGGWANPRIVWPTAP